MKESYSDDSEDEINKIYRKSLNKEQDVELKKIIKGLEEDVAMKIGHIEEGKDTGLEFDIKEEIKQQMLKEMRMEVKRKVSEYLTKMIATKVKDNINYEESSVFQDTVPPFYHPGIVLP